MTNATVTAKQAQVLEAMQAFFNYDSTVEERDDNAVAVDLTELAEAAELSVASARGVVGSLFKKGLLCEIEAGETGEDKCIGITDAGFDALDEIVGGAQPEDDQPEAEEVEEAEESTDWGAAFGSAYNSAREEGASKCKALRAVAASWQGERKDFLNAAQAYGVNKYTANTQYQQGKAD